MIMVNKYIKVVLAFLVLVILYFYWTQPYNYLDSSYPVYLAHPEVVCDSTSYDEIDLTIVSYNVKYGEKIDEAIDVLLSVPIVGNRVYLLQEMNPHAIDLIADQLGMYSVYFPLNNEYFSNQDFGNAILSSTPLYDPEKIIFPHGQLHNNRRRGMTLAITCLGGRLLLLGSVHASTVILENEKRQEQIIYMKDRLFQYHQLVDVSIIGGDFNSVTDSYTSFIKDQFESIGYEYNTIGLGDTHITPIHIPMLNAELDMIFCNKCNIVDQGVISDASASDHYPIWVQIQEEKN